MVPAWHPRLLQTPFLAPLAPVLNLVPWPDDRWPRLAELQALLDALREPPVSGGGRRLRVVPPEGPPGEGQAGYESRIYRTGELPTRPENWHDFFNVLAWAAFPRSKAALNRRHVQLIETGAGGTPGRRAPAQDALTQLDETGVVVAFADSRLAELMRAFRWKDVFWHRRAAVRRHMACVPFGHGLMEKALAPYTGMTGKGLLLPVEAGFHALPAAARLAHVDAAAAAAVEALERPGELQPVPVLGFPGLSADAEREAYYDNAAYFRPGRRAR